MGEVQGNINLAHHHQAMPVYELLCLARPALAKDEVGRMIRRVGAVLYERGGVIMDIRSYGDQPLAYKVRGGREKYEQVRT